MPPALRLVPPPDLAPRRSASFNDAAATLAYTGMQHKQQSPRSEHGEFEAPPAAGAARRPRSAQSVGGGGWDRGRVTFMLRDSTTVLSPTIVSPTAHAGLAPGQGGLERSTDTSPAAAGGSSESEASAASAAAAVAAASQLERLRVGPPHSNDAEQQQVTGGQAQALADGGGTQHPPTQQPSRPPPAPLIPPSAHPAPMGPVFVPLVLRVGEADYEPMVRDWHAWQAGAAGGAASVEAVLPRLRVLQAHLERAAAAGVPVVDVNVSSFQETLDALHDYVLQCIQLALEQEEGAAAAAAAHGGRGGGGGGGGAAADVG